MQDISTAFLNAARRHLQPFQETYGFIEENSDQDAQRGYLIIKFSHLRVRVGLEYGPQVTLDIGTPSDQWFSLVDIMRWLGRDASAAANAIIVTYETQVWDLLLDTRLKQQCDIAFSLMPTLIPLFGDDQWQQTLIDLAQFEARMAAAKHARFK